MSTPKNETPAYIGVVKWFNTEARYGFLRCAELDGDMYFHFESGERVMNDERGEAICCADERPRTYPEPGDRIYFRIANGKGSQLKAEPWCFADQYDRAVQRASRAKAA
jgi:hypothetical protein